MGPVRRFLASVLLSLAVTGATACVGQAINAPASVADIVVSSPSVQTEITVAEEDTSPRVGDTYVTVDRIDTEQVGVYRRGERSTQLSLVGSDRVTYRSEVLEVRAGGTTRWRLTFSEIAKRTTMGTMVLPGKPTPRLGVTYVIDISRKPTTVTDDLGQPVSAAEREAVLREVTIVKKPPRPHAPAGAAAPSAPPEPVLHTTRVGESMPWFQDRLERDYTHTKETSRTDGRVLEAILTEIRGVEGKPCAVVQVWIQAASKGPDDRRVEMELRGQALVRAEDGALLATAVKGQTKLHATVEGPKGEAVIVDAVGKIRVQSLRRWERRGAP